VGFRVGKGLNVDFCVKDTEKDFRTSHYHRDDDDENYSTPCLVRGDRPLVDSRTTQSSSSGMSSGVLWETTMEN
jgi:hypothetical protein